jgi:hypothetical protein
LKVEKGLLEKGLKGLLMPLAVKIVNGAIKVNPLQLPQALSVVLVMAEQFSAFLDKKVLIS